MALGTQRLERRLTDVTRRLAKARTELAVLEQQLSVFTDAADETRIRALVSETPLADREHTEAQRHADAMRRARADLAASIADLERLRDELLDKYPVS